MLRKKYLHARINPSESFLPQEIKPFNWPQRLSPDSKASAYFVPKVPNQPPGPLPEKPPATGFPVSKISRPSADGHPGVVMALVGLLTLLQFSFQPGTAG